MGGRSGTSTKEAHERSTKDVSTVSVPAKAVMMVEGGVGAGGAVIAATVISFSFFLPFIQGACPSIPPPFA
jgi:hypothetical protein